MQERPVLYWDITQRKVAIFYRRFGTDCPKTSVKNYHYILRNIPGERRYQFLSLFVVYFVASVPQVIHH
jgi:hypothetical protein